MTIQVRKATRKKAKLRLGVAAPSGCGKTMSSLLLAFGITGDWNKVGLIDTESGSGELYAGTTADTPEGPVKIEDYLYVRLDPPYTVANYLAAIRALENTLGSDGVIIEDSLSHAWSGTGGILERQGKAADRTGNSYTAWREFTPEHNSLIDAILQSPCHHISTMRSKTEYVLEENEKGKKAPRKVGMAPVQREGMEYEYTVFMDIDFKHQASATKDRTNTLKGKYFQISPKIGAMLRDWLDTGVDEIQLVLDALNEASSMAELQEAWLTKASPLFQRVGKADQERLTQAKDNRKLVLSAATVQSENDFSLPPVKTNGATDPTKPAEAAAKQESAATAA